MGAMTVAIDLPAGVLRRLEAEAARRGVSPDELAVELLEQSVAVLPPVGDTPDTTETDDFFGFRPFPERRNPVTNEAVDALRDEFAV